MPATVVLAAAAALAVGVAGAPAQQVFRPHKDRAYWMQIAGAPHPATSVPEPSPTPFDADLYTVRARNAREVIAGGAVCRENVPAAEVGSCERVPVIYSTDPEHPWREAYRSTEPGYVGAVAWIRRGEALAVGGTGKYPKREPNDPGEDWGYDRRVAHDRDHGAGRARAWHYRDGEWTEITDRLPAGMRGLSALDIWIGREADGDDWGLAGAYGQIWEWEGGRFTGSNIDRDSPSFGARDPEWAVVEGPQAHRENCPPTQNENCPWVPDGTNTSSARYFQYRVREIRIPQDTSHKRAFAFTAGCCGRPADGGSRLIEYVDAPRKNRVGVPPDDAPPRAERPRWVVHDDHASSDADYGESVYSFMPRPGRHFNFFGTADEFDEPQPNHGAQVWSAGARITATATPETEPQSQPTDPLLPRADNVLRFVAGDGDSEPTLPQSADKPVRGNGTADWKAGEAPRADDKLRGAGVVATELAEYREKYGGVRPYCEQKNSNWSWAALVENSSGYEVGFGDTNGNRTAMVPTPEVLTGIRICRAEQISNGDNPRLDEESPVPTSESGVQIGPSWSLRAIDVLDQENIGYAVGDRGAILRFAQPPVETDPPTLGDPRPGPLPDKTPYDAGRPAAAAVAGEVPPLAAQPRERHEDPVMFRGGSADGNEIATDLPVADVAQIVMSRDGSEGWAIGPTQEARGILNNGGVMTLQHYRAGQWTRCDPVGSELLKADDACAGIADVWKLEQSGLLGAGVRIRLDAATRVPLENDSDASNDDEFEVLAVGQPLERITSEIGRAIPTILRYRDGRWRLEDFEVRSSLNSYEASGTRQSTFGFTITSLTCGAPDDCWLVGKSYNSSRLLLSRFDGKRWVDCTSTGQTGGVAVNRAACGDPDKRLDGLDFGSGASVAVASAGRRVFVGGQRGAATFGTSVGGGPPVVLYRDGPDGKWRNDTGGYERTGADARPGEVTSIMATRRPDGRYEGWATGAFEGPLGHEWPLLRLDHRTGKWQPHKVRDAAHDHLVFHLGATAPSPLRVAMGGADGDAASHAYLATRSTNGGGVPSYMLAFNPRRERWELAQRPGVTPAVGGESTRVTAVGADGRGGAWATFATGQNLHSTLGSSNTYFYNYTTSPPREVFSDSPHPMADRETLSDLATAADGTVWLATEEGTLYRRDRLTGWTRTTIPGWDPGRVVTRPTAIEAVAIAPNGSGLAVGAGGRVARIEPDGVILDPAAGRVCDRAAPDPPCSTSFRLRSVALSPNGAALVGGDKLALLWRPPLGDLRKIPPPDGPSFATIVDIAMPSDDRAWLALDSGHIFAGEETAAGVWRWRLENSYERDGTEHLLNEDVDDEPIALRAIALDKDGKGYAVGDRGVILERTGDEAAPWRLMRSWVTERLMSVTLSPGGPGALIGGDRGLILSLVGGEWRLARAGDQLRADDGYVDAVAIRPGMRDGQVEAWAGVAPQRTDQRIGTSQVLHYTSAPGEPLLTPERGAKPLPDVPEPQPGTISFAAFGRSDCHGARHTGWQPCPPHGGGQETEQTILRRIRDELLGRRTDLGGPQFAIFTGDAYDTANTNAVEPIEQNSRAAGTAVQAAPGGGGLQLNFETGGEKFRRLNEQVIDWMRDRSVPVWAPIGARDLSETSGCFTTTATIHCPNNRERGRVGENLAWRQSMESQPAPWGRGEPVATNKLAFRPLDSSGLAVRVEDREVDDPTDSVERQTLPGADLPRLYQGSPERFEGGQVGGREEVGNRPVAIGGASTHYASDIVRDGRKVGRLVVVDNSLGSLAASDAVQQPAEPEGGQAGWLERVLCIRGSVSDAGQCTREPGQQAIVVANAPTYSYGPTNPTELQADAAVFESILLKNRANVVVSGKLGWNGRYWATAAGVHEPCPGGAYQETPPEQGTRVCGRGDTAATDTAGKTLSATLRGLGAPQPPATDEAALGVLPFVVASGAGGRLDDVAEGTGATRGEEAGSRGFWRGYTIVHLDPSGDPAKTFVEQRPVFDWIGIRAATHVLRPGQRVALRGVGREPMATPVGGDLRGQLGSARLHRLDSPAITHRYDLVEADREKPWLPKVVEGNGNPHGYVPLDPAVATVDQQSGRVVAGRGNRGRVYAIALLSVGKRVASWPMVFEPRKSYVPPAPRKLTIPPAVPPIRVLGIPAQAVPSQPPPNPPATPPIAVDLALPPPPAIPGLPGTTPTPIAPPIPPATPPPPASQGQVATGLAANPLAILLAPTAAPIPPSSPLIQPAPPSGARREARQKQAATAKSEEGGSGATQGAEGDLAQGRENPGGSAFRRHDREKAAPAGFTPRARGSQPSAWATGLQYGGGTALMALVLALGWTTVRPTPRGRRREDVSPAPAWLRRR